MFYEDNDLNETFSAEDLDGFGDNEYEIEPEDDDLPLEDDFSEESSF